MIITREVRYRDGLDSYYVVDTTNHSVLFVSKDEKECEAWIEKENEEYEKFHEWDDEWDDGWDD